MSGEEKEKHEKTKRLFSTKTCDHERRHNSKGFQKKGGTLRKKKPLLERGGTPRRAQSKGKTKEQGPPVR